MFKTQLFTYWKTILLSFVVLLTSIGLCGQNDSIFYKNKIDINALSLFWGHLEIGYERVISNKTAIRLILGKTDYYRDYDFGNTYIDGYSFELQYKRYLKPPIKYFPKFNFFFGAYSFYKYEYIDDTNMEFDENDYTIWINEKFYSNSFCIGMMSGIKYIQRKRFITELYFGMGYYNGGFYDGSKDYKDLHGKLGLSIGITF